MAMNMNASNWGRGGSKAGNAKDRREKYLSESLREQYEETFKKITKDEADTLAELEDTSAEEIIKWDEKQRASQREDILARAEEEYKKKKKKGQEA